MKVKDLKLFAGNKIMESKLSDSAKIQILEFIKTANEAQVKALIMDGKIVQLDEQAEQIVNDRFKLHLNEGAGINIMLGALGLLVTYNMIRRKYQECSKKCAAVPKRGIQKSLCMNQCALKQETDKLSVYTKALSKCKSYKNPEKCKDAITKNIAKTKQKIAKLNDKISKLSTKAAMKGKRVASDK